MSEPNQPPPLVLAARGIYFLVSVGFALVLALVTPLGGIVDGLQAEVFGGTYMPKLTLLIVVVGVFLAGAIVYVPFEIFVLRPRLTPRS